MAASTSFCPGRQPMLRCKAAFTFFAVLCKVGVVSTTCKLRKDSSKSRAEWPSTSWPAWIIFRCRSGLSLVAAMQRTAPVKLRKLCAVSLAACWLYISLPCAVALSNWATWKIKNAFLELQCFALNEVKNDTYALTDHFGAGYELLGALFRGVAW